MQHEHIIGASIWSVSPAYIRDMQALAREAQRGTRWITAATDERGPSAQVLNMLQRTFNAQINVAADGVVFGVNADPVEVAQGLTRTAHPAGSPTLWKTALECLRGPAGDTVGLSANAWLQRWLAKPHRALRGASTTITFQE